MAASVPQKLVGIIGAGIAGPAFALQLLSHPRLASLYRPLLLDKTPDPSVLSSEDQAKKESASFGAAVAVFPNGLHPLYALGLREAVESVSLPLDIISFWKSPTASSTPHYEYGTIDHPTWSHGLQSDAINIERSALRDMLLKAARERGCETMWDKKIKGFEEQDKGATKINFEDGSDLIVDLLVGADGGYSMVRKYILDKRDPATAEKRWLPDFMHQTGFYGISRGFPYDKDVSSRATIGIWLDRGMLASAPVPGDKIRWDLVLPEEEAPPASRAVADTPKSEEKFPWESAILPSAYTHDSSVEILQKHMNAFHPAAGTIGNLLENAEQIIRTPLRQRVWKAKEIQYGNVALIGDAARLMLPSSGQGMFGPVQSSPQLLIVTRNWLWHRGCHGACGQAAGALQIVRRPERPAPCSGSLRP